MSPGLEASASFAARYASAESNSSVISARRSAIRVLSSLSVPLNAPKPGRTPGQFTTSPASARIVMSSHVHPVSRITLARPGMRPPVGVTPARRTPFSRVTGISVESGLIATLARTSGVYDPISFESFVARTELVSVSPSRVSAANSPG